MRNGKIQLIGGLVLTWLAAGTAYAGTPYLRGVPYFNQGYNQIDPYGSCQNTCMAMVLQYYGAQDITPDSISARWGTDPAKAVNGWENLFNILAEERGLTVRDRGVSDGRLSAVRRQLDAGLPVVVHGTFSSSGGHLIVLLGYDDEYYYANDPAGDMTAGFHDAPDAGRHVRYSRESVEKAISDPLSGRVRFHFFHFDAAPLLAEWGRVSPDSTVAGETLELKAEVRVIRLAENGDPLQVTANLGELGGPTELSLTQIGDQVYHLETALRIGAEMSGWKLLEIEVEQRAGGETFAWKLTREIAVLPSADQQIYGDGWAADWTGGQLFAAALDPAVGSPVFAGTAALQVRAEGALLQDMGAEVFVAGFQPQGPLPTVGYQNLRFAFHPGDSHPVGEGRLAIFVNDDLRTAVLLSGGPEDLVDLERRAWQDVEIPMRHFTWLERPIESIGLIGELQGNLYLDEVRLTAAHPCPLAASWTILPPASVVAGETFFLSTEVHLDRIAEAGGVPWLTADLSGLGGPAELLLEPIGQRTYRLEQVLAPELANGVKPITVCARQVEGEALHAVVLIRDVVVLPAEDLRIFADGFAPGWKVEYAYSAELDPDATVHVREGRSSLAMRTDNFTVDLAASEPVEPVGYQALRVAFHPGDATGGRKPAFTVMVNGDARTAVRLLGGTEADYSLRLDLLEWQVLEIPLEAFGDFDGPLASLRFLGNLRGTFYLDDVRLVAARPSAPATVVLGTQARPHHFILHPAYPNPFNASATIGFALESGTPIQLEIFNLLGQRVRRLAWGWHEAGRHAVQWDGRDDVNQILATGSYLCRLRSVNQVETRKLLLIR